MTFIPTQLRTLTREHRTEIRPLARLWAALIDARGERLNEGSQHVLDIIVDMRERVDLPLPAQFIEVRLSILLWRTQSQISPLKRH